MASSGNKLQPLLSSLKEYAQQSEENRTEVRDALGKASSEIETPFEQLHTIVFANQVLGSTLKACLDLDLFALWEKQGDGAYSAEQLAGMTKSDPVMIARLLRNLAAHGKIDEVRRDRYKLTDFARSMATPQYSSGISLLYHSITPIMGHLPKYLATTDYRNPTDLDHTNWNDMQKTDLNWFQYLEAESESGRLQDFHNVMQIYSIQSGNWTEVYPTETLFVDYDPSSPLLVDAGGGKGHDLEIFRSKYHDLEPGALVLEDLTSVIDSVRGTPHESIKLLPVDLLESQPIKGARAYFTHSVFHGWTNSQSILGLKNFASAMKKSYSKLLIHEKVIPAVKASKVATTGDILMMATHSAQERTEVEWEDLLKQAGLKLVKVWLNKVYPEGIIEAEVP